MREYLEFVGDSQHSDATSAKFWEVVVDGPTITVRWGKIGSKGRSKTTTYDSHSTAQSEARKQVEAKTKKGYRSTSPSAPAEATQKSAPGITDKQLALLRRLVVERQVPPDHESAAGTLEGLTRAQASAMISALLEQPKKTRETSTASTEGGASADMVPLTAKQRGLILRLLDEREVPADLTLTTAEIDALPRGKASEVISTLLDSPKRKQGPPASRTTTSVPVEIREALVNNPNTPAELFAELAWHRDLGVQERIAADPSTPTETLTRLASHEDASPENVFVRAEALRNPSTPSEVLTTLASDRKNSVRSGVADNPSTPPETLTTLASDREIFVRRGVADNPSTPPETLTTLASDQWHD